MNPDSCDMLSAFNGAGLDSDWTGTLVPPNCDSPVSSHPPRGVSGSHPLPLVFSTRTSIRDGPMGSPYPPPMNTLFQNHGLLFRYPAAWTLTEEAGDGCVAITVAPNETAFWSATILEDRPEVEEILEAAVDTFMELYDEVDVFDLTAELARHSGLGRDIEFVCFELLNRAELRAFRTAHCMVLVTCQGTDDELGELQPMFDEITCSLEVPDGFLAGPPQRWVEEE